VKRAVVLAIYLLCFSCGAAFAGVADRPAKLSLVPGLELPKTDNVKGLDLGVFGTRTDTLEGIQSAMCYARLDRKSSGIQYACVTISEDFTGIKLAFVNTGRNVNGIMMGFVNTANKVHGLQFGIVNIVSTMYGFQFGLVNVIKPSKLPVMIILNAGF
jgi:hypothetical protein